MSRVETPMENKAHFLRLSTSAAEHGWTNIVDSTACTSFASFALLPAEPQGEAGARCGRARPPSPPIAGQRTSGASSRSDLPRGFP